MILAALLLTMVFGESDFPLVARLRSCGTPETESQALRCLDRSLSQADRRAIIQKPQPTFNSRERAGAWSQDHADLVSSIEDGLGLDDESSPLVREYEHRGFPTAKLMASPVQLVLESYWLQSNGCQFGASERVKVKLFDIAEDERASASEVQDDAAGFSRLTVDCSSGAPFREYKVRPLP